MLLVYGEKNNNVDRQIWINVGLLVFIVILSAILVMPEEQVNQNLPRLTDIKQNDIVTIEVLRKNLDNFEFIKQDETWQMHSPLKFMANNARINAMLHLLKAESHGELNSADVELTRFDLTDPNVTIKFNGHIFQFGNTDAIDQRRYVLFNGKIHLVNDSLYAQLTTNAAFFADPKIVPHGFKINGIQFPDNKIEMHDGQWQLQNLMDISPDQLKQVIFAWNNTAAISVNKYSEPDLASSIMVSSVNGKTIEFIVVSTEPHLVLGRREMGIQYHLGSDESAKLLLSENPELNVPQETLELH